MSQDPVSRHEFEEFDYKLASKIDEIEQVREQNSRLALDAAWGLVPAIRGLPVWGVALYLLATSEWPWWGDALAILTAFLITTYMSVKANDQRMDEVDRLHTISSWRDNN